MIVIHYPTAFKALDRFIDRFNAGKEKICQRLRTGAVMTAKELIRIYGASLLKADSIPEGTRENLPALQANNQQLAKLVKCSARTIQRHINRLRQAGIVTHKIFHGSKANYELLINPEILLVKERLSVENTNQTLRASLEASRQKGLQVQNRDHKTTICLPTYSGNTGKQINNLIIQVDKLKTGNVTGNAGEIVLKKKETEIFEKKFGGKAGEIVSRVARSGQSDARPDVARDNSITLYSGLLWMMARKLLYRDADLTQRQMEIARRRIYKLYEAVPTDHLSDIHSQYVARISLVDKYLRKDPGKRFVTLPYLYFDTTNPNGFAGTKKWYEKDQRRKQEVKRELTLNRLIRNYLHNEKKAIAQRQPPLQLFRQCERILTEFNDPVLLKRFYAAVLDYETQYQIKSEILVLFE